MSASPPLAVLRADATPETGAGHVMRCLAIGAALGRRGVRCVLATRAGTARTIAAEWLEAIERIELPDREDHEVEAIRAIRPDGADILIVDHYERGRDFEIALRPWVERLLVVDDAASRDHCCDLLVNSAPGFTRADYDARMPGDALALLGPAYAPLRPSFEQLRPASLAQRNEPRPVERIVIAFGATDPVGMTVRVLDSLARLALEVAIDVVLGAASPHAAAVRRRAGAMKRVRVHDSGNELAPLLAAADFAIGAAGVGAWERCALGLASLAVPIVDNQAAVAAALREAGAACVVPFEGLTDASLDAALSAQLEDAASRAAQTRAGAALVDGLGGRRIVQALCPPLSRGEAPVRLRPAGPDDAARLFDWQHEPGARRYARESDLPEPAGHARWLATRLADPTCWLNIVLCAEQPAGMLLLDALPGEPGRPFEVSILTARAWQGRGVARAALGLACDLAGEAVLHAYVHPDNAVSARLFEAAGFVPRDGWFIHDPAAAVAGSLSTAVRA